MLQTSVSKDYVQVQDLEDQSLIGPHSPGRTAPVAGSLETVFGLSLTFASAAFEHSDTELKASLLLYFSHGVHQDESMLSLLLFKSSSATVLPTMGHPGQARASPSHTVVLPGRALVVGAFLL